MLIKKMEAALNSQLNAETYSAYLYLSMAAYFQSVSLGGFANWMRIQAQEELTHSMKFYDFINERGGRVTLTAIDAPPTKWKSTLDVFEATLSHEQKVTGLITVAPAASGCSTRFQTWKSPDRYRLRIDCCPPRSASSPSPAQNP